MKRKLAYIIGVPLLFSCLAFQGNCYSQCEELIGELVKLVCEGKRIGWQTAGARANRFPDG